MVLDALHGGLLLNLMCNNHPCPGVWPWKWVLCRNSAIRLSHWVFSIKTEILLQFNQPVSLIRKLVRQNQVFVIKYCLYAISVCLIVLIDLFLMFLYLYLFSIALIVKGKNELIQIYDYDAIIAIVNWCLIT